MAFKQVLLCCFLAVAFTYAMTIQSEEPRLKRDTNQDAMAKMEEAFQGFKQGLNSLVNNISQSDIYKQFEKIGADLGDKGKELGAKIEETLSNLKKSASSS
uniref:Venom peptide Pp26a n=1 Tax=Pristhesancus plagipennis TaxID=1955184 RepID=A0A2K8JLL6_PRIPG|nr:venom peptide Pp26a [Pristhesancus plagipennis]